MFENYYQKIRSILAVYRREIIIFACILFVVFLIIFVLFLIKKLKPQVVPVTLSSYSRIILDKNRSYFSINTENGYLYKTKREGQEAIDEFLKSNGKVNGQDLLPNNFYKNSKIIRVAKDSELNPKYSTSSNSKEHYFLSQKINGIPIYGASLIIHLQNKNEIYSISGNIATNDSITKEKISEKEAVGIATNQAAKDSSYATDLVVKDSSKSILNLKLLGLSEDVVNHLTLAVQFDSAKNFFSKRYYVDLSNRKMLYSEDLITQVMTRKVYDCNGTSNPPCSLRRSEGEPPMGDLDGDSLYDLMGEVYNYYFNTFGRDALDGAGAPLQGIVKIYSVNGTPCSVFSNAYNTGGAGGGIMAYCKGTATRDIAAHEFTHGVVSTTAGLAPGYQYGALNESLADSFANAIDNNWTMGEGSALGIIRNMSNPPSSRNDPDKLFSSTYDCVGEEVHKNAGVPNKAFYLMTDGGSFNGCSMSGIGTVKSHEILYKALTQYLSSTANFFDLYSGVNQACNDIHGASSTTCEEAKKAYQATEMDQQTPGSSRGAKCTGRVEQTATCAGGSFGPTNTPTPSPTPGGPANTPTPSPTPGGSTATPTPIVASSGLWKLKATPICSGNVSNISYDYEIPSGERAVIETINSAGNPLGIEDMSSWVGGPPYIVGNGTYIAKGNRLSPVDSGLKNNYGYTSEYHYGTPGHVISLILTLNVKTLDCTNPPLPTSTPTPGGPINTSIPTPTPQKTYTCVPDPTCVSSGKVIQMCPLKCTEN